jgi:hypothetical protein
MQTDPKLPDDWDPIYLPDDGFPRDIRRALEDGEVEVISVEVTETKLQTAVGDLGLRPSDQQGSARYARCVLDFPKVGDRQTQ